jgi:hypothetical protein
VATTGLVHCDFLHSDGNFKVQFMMLTNFSRNNESTPSLSLLSNIAARISYSSSSRSDGSSSSSSSSSSSCRSSNNSNNSSSIRI